LLATPQAVELRIINAAMRHSLSKTDQTRASLSHNDSLDTCAECLNTDNYVPTNMKRLFKILLIAIAVSGGFSACCTINHHLGAYGIGPEAPMDVNPPLNGDLTARLALSNSDCN